MSPLGIERPDVRVGDDCYTITVKALGESLADIFSPYDLQVMESPNITIDIADNRQYGNDTR